MERWSLGWVGAGGGQNRIEKGDGPGRRIQRLCRRLVVVGRGNTSSYHLSSRSTREPNFCTIETWSSADDRNEPKYCYCNQVSFGEMLGCEVSCALPFWQPTSLQSSCQNDECPLEWFHLPCTGLPAPPSGKWYCNVCRPKPGLGQATVSRKKHRKR